MEIVVRFDGACWPNPNGLASYGFVVEGLGDVIEGGGIVGSGPGMTNNVAEYTALLRGLDRAYESAFRLGLKLTPKDSLTMVGDSLLVVKTVAGKWRVKQDNLVGLRRNILKVLNNFSCPWKTVWVSRDENGRCDELAGAAYEAATGRSVPEFRKT